MNPGGMENPKTKKIDDEKDAECKKNEVENRRIIFNPQIDCLQLTTTYINEGKHLSTPNVI
ncbi:hypothetical protein SYK_15890 [Pseudodesulfovibrio nedwellii]|uniref:Uncharacterized protein n=1 Tax=Pseudodesulfovibrio nedwellii TaxID=2973072 RepID=A0ABM8B0C2_9BACT|nr:hypothetical protein SYK_15890 [Pseudodesulfovibrio nedwellii]